MKFKDGQKLKIGGMTYELRIRESWPGRQKGEHDGETFYDKENGAVIYVGAELLPEAQETTLIHEILHCLNSTMDHEFLDSLAEQIYQVLKDNDFLA